MSTAQLLQHLRELASAQPFANVGDAELLTQFVENRDEASFEMLLKRHGPMVLGVCRRILHNGDDVEDAFQATFLIFVRKATAIAPRELVGNWLYGVAVRTAKYMQKKAAQRGQQPLDVGDVPDARKNTLAAELDDELQRLPEKYRLPLLLCDLQGYTRQEAAELLGWPAGTVAGRLARARLAEQLKGSGFTLPAVDVPVLVEVGHGSVPAALRLNLLHVAMSTLSKTTNATPSALRALILSKEVLNDMFWQKTKATVVAVCAVAVFGIGLTLTVLRGEASGRPRSGGNDAKVLKAFNPTDGQLTRTPPASENRVSPAQTRTVHVAGVCRKVEDGLPVPNTEVRFYTYHLHSHPHLKLWKTVKGNPAGVFVIGGKLPVNHDLDIRRCQIYVVSPGRATRCFYWQPDAKYNPPVELKLHPPQSIQGKVVGPDGRPVAGTLVRALMSVPGIYNAVTDKKGHYDIDDLEPWKAKDDIGFTSTAPFAVGGRCLRIHHKNFGGRTLLYTAVPSTVNVRFSEPALIAGRVIDDAGRPLAGIKVFANGEGGSTVYRTSTDKDERYQFLVQHDVDDDYTIVIRRRGFRDVRRTRIRTTADKMTCVADVQVSD